MAKRSFYITDEEFDNYQVKVVQRRVDNSFIVKGCAGSGKSILALWKVKQIQEEKKGSFYFIIFTKTLRKYMEDGIEEVGLNSDRVLHFKQWKKLGYPSADYLVVDEVQDFDESEINILKEKANKALIVYGDSAQQLYAFKNDTPLSMEDIAYITKYPMETLVFNHRLPKTIARFAEYIEGTGDELVARCQTEGIELPKVLKYSNLNEQLDAIIEIIKTRNYDDVGIFLQTNSDVENAYNYFNSKGFKVEYKFDKNKKTFSMLDFSTNLPKLTTYHSSKGLQFEAVFLPDCEDKFPNNKQDNKNALYVAITRSYQDLFIMYSDNLVPFLNDIPKNLYKTSLLTEDIDW